MNLSIVKKLLASAALGAAAFSAQAQDTTRIYSAADTSSCVGECACSNVRPWTAQFVGECKPGTIPVGSSRGASGEYCVSSAGELLARSGGVTRRSFGVPNGTEKFQTLSYCDLGDGGSCISCEVGPRSNLQGIFTWEVTCVTSSNGR